MLDNGTTLLIDRNHYRYVRLHQLKVRQMRFYRLTEDQAKRTLLDVPPDVALALF